jgi:hypothetical protein
MSILPLSSNSRTISNGEIKMSHRARRSLRDASRGGLPFSSKHREVLNSHVGKSHRSRRSLNDPNPRVLTNHHFRKSHRSRRSLNKHFPLYFREIRARVKNRLLLTKFTRRYSGSKYKTKKRSRRQVEQQKNPISGIKVTNITIHGLLPNTMYIFSIQAVNSGGKGPTSQGVYQRTLDSGTYSEN